MMLLRAVVGSVLIFMAVAMVWSGYMVFNDEDIRDHLNNRNKSSYIVRPIEAPKLIDC